MGLCIKVLRLQRVFKAYRLQVKFQGFTCALLRLYMVLKQSAYVSRFSGCRGFLKHVGLCRLML